MRNAPRAQAHVYPSNIDKPRVPYKNRASKYFGRRHRCLAARRSDKLTLDRIVDSLHHPLSEQDVVKQLYYQDISILPPDTLFFLREKWLPYVAS